MSVIHLMKKARVFMKGRSQVVRLPKEFRFDCDEVFIVRQGDKVILTACKPDWDAFFDSRPVFGDDFLSDREDAPPHERGVLV